MHLITAPASRRSALRSASGRSSQTRPTRYLESKASIGSVSRSAAACRRACHPSGRAQDRGRRRPISQHHGHDALQEAIPAILRIRTPAPGGPARSGYARICGHRPAS
jgi:hypothetical protein